MKYKRLTKRISDGEEAFLFHSSLHEGIERLAELEDKIERGELIELMDGQFVCTEAEWRKRSRSVKDEIKE